MTSFRADYYCRLCVADSSQKKELTVEDQQLMRNEISYAEDLKNLNDNKLQSSRGIKEECVFTEL